ncbi:MAG: hypothetical protein AB7F32_08600 [Victivallaceae bacterium]
MASEANTTESTAAPVNGNPPDGYWTAPEVTIAVIIGLGLAVAAAALIKLFAGSQLRRS